MRKTKIVCTLGPATDGQGVLRQMIQAGMNVARFNFSHGSYDEHQRRLEALTALREELHLPVAAMLDTKGPEVRLRTFQNGPVHLKTGQSFTLTTDDVPGDETRCSITYADLPQDVKPGNTILLDDGLVRLTVLETTAREIRCRVENDGVMKDKKGVNVPGVSLSMPYMSQRDREDILFGIRQGFDFIAASFVRSAADVREIRHILDKNHSKIRIIAQCVAAGKPVITATQMLDSMIENPRPTRAEITDVANAIYDGTSAIMLSGETAAGKYPVEAVRTMDAIARKTESNVERICPAKTPRRTRLSITAATAHAACTTAEDIGADAILTVSQRGITAQMVSRFRPAATVVALLLDPQVQRQMALYWGLVPITMPRASSTDQLVDLAIQSAQEAGLVKHGDLVVVTAGVPVGISGTTNMIRIAQVGGALVNAIGIGSQTASGPLCICRTLEEIPEKFHPGDVLVVPYTNNDVVPWLRQAAAIVSEEASADCHTATVGLLLNKPVIVAASDATRRLKDGTLVSVDCARGIVQTIPQ